jgi:hypothetical protein
MRQRISPSSVVVAAKGQVSCDLAGEAAILDFKTGIYYGLNSVGARIWDLIKSPRPMGEIREALLEKYHVEPSRCEQDLLELLEELRAADLIEVTE